MACTDKCPTVRGRAAHCGACHSSFAGVSLFDDHRKGGRCNAPGSLGMRQDARGRWHSGERREWPVRPPQLATDART
jgi:hypothetical protein